MEIKRINVFCDNGEAPKCDITYIDEETVNFNIHSWDKSNHALTYPVITFFLDSVYDLIKFRDSVNHSVNKAIKEFHNGTS